MPTSVAAMTFEVSIGVVLTLRGRYTWRGKFLVREVIRNCGFIALEIGRCTGFSDVVSVRIDSAGFEDV